jgi:hypothetical protein
MGGAERATSGTGNSQEAENVRGRFESYKRRHQEALGGLPQSPRIGRIGDQPWSSRRDRSRAYDVAAYREWLRVISPRLAQLCYTRGTPFMSGARLRR